MSLQTFVKANFLAGLFGTLVLSPLGIVFELIQSGPGGFLQRFWFLEVVMLLFVPLLVAMGFAVTALAAFPVVRWFQRNDLISFTGP